MTTKRKHWSDALLRFGPCEEGLRWARKQPTYAAAWRECRNGEFMEWLIGRLFDAGEMDRSQRSTALKANWDASIRAQSWVQERTATARAIRAAIQRPKLKGCR